MARSPASERQAVMKKLACRLGRHEWTTRVEEGESYKVCASCGKMPPGSLPPGSKQALIPPGAESGGAK
jgi:hypothetical protein